MGIGEALRVRVSDELTLDAGQQDEQLADDGVEPLALIFASRTILLGLVLIVLALRRKREWLAWVLLADAALQLFDTGMALATNKGALALLPAALGAIDVWAGLFLLRAARVSPAVASRLT